jgi:hypothetical protein
MSMFGCDARIRETGQPCCDRCLPEDTHGLLPEHGDVQIRREIANLIRVTAEQVIARTEHARAIRELRADVADLIGQVAGLRAELTEAVRSINARLAVAEPEVRHGLLVDVMTEVRQVVRDLPERLDEVEDCVVGIETHLKLRRKPKTARPKALPPGPLPPPRVGREQQRTVPAPTEP